MQEWMTRMYGPLRKSDSMRCRIGQYVYEHSPNRLNVDAICKILDYTPKQVQSELDRIARRSDRYNMPYQLRWYENNTIALIPTK
jgi:hypothetical protein